MMVRGAYSQLMAGGLRKLFVQWRDLEQRTEEWPLVFNTPSSDSAFFDDVEFAGLGPQLEKPEGESVTYADAIQGGGKRYIHYVYALGCRMSFELIDDDQYGLIKTVPKCLARSAVFTREQVTWNVFNLGFTTVTTSDGLALFHNQHPLLGGTAATAVGPGLTNVISAAGTYPNRPATDVDISYTAIQLMINQFERLVDAQGLPVALKPRQVLIPPELKFIAREILGSPNKPYTSDNEINSLLAEDLQFMVVHFFTSQSAWFVICDKATHQLNHATRKKLTEKAEDDFDTQSVKYIALQRFAVGATSWNGTWGSLGP